MIYIPSQKRLSTENVPISNAGWERNEFAQTISKITLEKMIRNKLAHEMSSAV